MTLFRGTAQDTIPDGAFAGLPIEVTWDSSLGVTKKARGVATASRFDAAIGPDAKGRTYRFVVGFDQKGRARAVKLTISARRSLPRQVSVDIDELVRSAVDLYATQPRAVFKVKPSGPGSWMITPASKREAHALVEHQDLGVPRDVTDEFLRGVCREYEQAIAERRSAWRAIEERYSISHATCGNWLAEARRRGLLKTHAPKQPKPVTKKRGKR